ncbi:hypothetical protein [Caballeronia sp. GAWG2-1]|uniref:hypothetical protein n=1 Tax=Caballeronia sp. GAWG2-1 TaxID=2921744 RepID=UPI0020290C52|nr:hypothetical protein [Caballeronia sp. GAWG2-1]
MNLVPTVALSIVQHRAGVAKAEPTLGLALQQLEQVQPATAALSRLFVGLRHLIRGEQIQRLACQIKSQIEQLPVLAPDLPRFERGERRSEVGRVDLVDERQEEACRRSRPTNGQRAVITSDDTEWLTNVSAIFAASTAATLASSRRKRSTSSIVRKEWAEREKES